MREQEQRRVVTCPACERRFRLPRTGGPRPGQRLRCGRCGHVFRLEKTDPEHQSAAAVGAAASAATEPPKTTDGDSATPHLASEDDAAPHSPLAMPEDEEDAPVAAQPQAMPEQRDDGDNHAQATAESADAVLRALRERNRSRTRRPVDNKPRASRLRRLAIGLGWFAWVALVGGVIWLVLAAPEDWRRHWPLIERAHALFVTEAPAEAPLTLSLTNRGVWEETPEGWRLMVDGLIRNHSDRTQVIPPIIVLLRDDTGRIHAKAIARPEAARVPPHGEVSFAAELERIRLDGRENAGVTLVAEFARIAPRSDTATSSPAGERQAPAGQPQENSHGAHPGR